MTVRAIRTDARAGREPMHKPVIENHMWNSRTNELTGLDDSTEDLGSLKASTSARSSISYSATPKYTTPLSKMEADESDTGLQSQPSVNVGCLVHHIAPAHDPIEDTCKSVADPPAAYCRLIDDDGINKSVSSSASWKTFQARVLSLPPEICQMIMDMLFAHAFGPRDVHPQLDAPVTDMFLSLDKQLYDKYSHIFWSTSTWIVGAGPANDTMRFMTLPPHDTSTTKFSLQIPNTAAFSIRRVVLRFSKHDLPSSPLTQRPFRCSDASTPNNDNPTSTSTSTPEFADETTQPITPLPLPHGPKSNCIIRSETLKRIWQEKFERVAFLKLDYLCLDVREAYADDGAFLGKEVVGGLLPFYYCMPNVLEVRARTGEEEGDVKAGLEAINEKAKQ